MQINYKIQLFFIQSLFFYWQSNNFDANKLQDSTVLYLENLLFTY